MATAARWPVEKGQRIRLESWLDYMKYLGDVSEAKEALEACEKDPNHTPQDLKKNLLKWVDAVVTYGSNWSKLYEARSALEKGIDIDSNDHEAKAKLGMVIYFLVDNGAYKGTADFIKHCKTALDLFKSVKDKYPEDPFIDIEKVLQDYVDQDKAFRMQYPAAAAVMDREFLEQACEVAEDEHLRNPDNVDILKKYNAALKKLSDHYVRESGESTAHQ